MPDDGTIHYDYSRCESVYEQLVQDQVTIGVQITSLENTINGLLRTWTGVSASQWQTIQGQWMTALDNMASDLSKAASSLPEMARNMQIADKNAAFRIASIGQS